MKFNPLRLGVIVRLVRLLFFAAAFALLPQTGRANFGDDLAKASVPTSDGVPEVAIVRLQSLAKQNLTTDQRRLVSENLVQALIAANRPAEAVSFIKDNKLVQTANDKFWYAQALASLGQTAEALSLYDAAAADDKFLLRSDAMFGAAEMLRVLNRPDDAIRRLTLLLQVLMKLRDAGNTLLVIEHNLEMVKYADWIIDLGPEGGEQGGRVVAAGPPEYIATVKDSYTGNYLGPLLDRK